MIYTFVSVNTIHLTCVTSLCWFECCNFELLCFILSVVWAVDRTTSVCFRIVLGIITKKNILEHLEELKQHTEPLVTSPTPFFAPHMWPLLHSHTCLLGSARCERLVTVPGWTFEKPSHSSSFPLVVRGLGRKVLYCRSVLTTLTVAASC